MLLMSLHSSFQPGLSKGARSEERLGALERYAETFPQPMPAMIPYADLFYCSAKFVGREDGN